MIRKMIFILGFVSLVAPSANASLRCRLQLIRKNLGKTALRAGEIKEAENEYLESVVFGALNSGKLVKRKGDAPARVTGIYRTSSGDWRVELSGFSRQNRSTPSREVFRFSELQDLRYATRLELKHETSFAQRRALYRLDVERVDWAPPILAGSEKEALELQTVLKHSILKGALKEGYDIIHGRRSVLARVLDVYKGMLHEPYAVLAELVIYRDRLAFQYRLQVRHVRVRDLAFLRAATREDRARYSKDEISALREATRDPKFD